MICVSLGRTRHKMMIAEHRALAERGAELVELRVDWIPRNLRLDRLIKDRPTEVILTCRRPQDGGRFDGSEEKRLQILREGIVAGVEYVDLEVDIAKKVPRYGKTKRIVSFHDFEKTPDDLEEIHKQLCECDADIVKIVTMADSPADNVRMMKLVESAKVPTVGFCMGEQGLVSRVLCGKYGAPFTYATFNKERVMAPGQLSFDEMKKLYRYDSIDKDTKVYAVLGDPIAHSWSPLLHNLAFIKTKLNSVYVPLRVSAEDFDELVKEYEFFGIEGYSVTIPHKHSALEFATQVEEAAEEIGAANTLIRQSNGEWFARNTDYDAALESIHLGLEMKSENSLNGQRVLILGAGGVARAIGLGAVRQGAVVTITNRSKGRAVKLAEDLNCQSVTWENRGSVGVDVVVNCTPVGMFPDMNESPYHGHWLREGVVVFDTIYNPENTLLLKQAKTRLCHTVSGIEMFVRQAAAQFKAFTGIEAPLDQMRTSLRRSISPVRVKTEQGHAAPSEQSAKTSTKSPQKPADNNEQS
ncbi:Shikimate dehydrogenase [Thalassoglobus neptunius]|uniref:Multifunctional fusion protein n=1 Tax=Thalassoglobus neptunius TaxID=1938619 RepID=A0A5C5X921_9PLAN|nr:shikimate dehydrogenase [Thalassoglobus neptunius]TWT58645.1 Shikimate dehydrogenase [Thalassoglobus neptunius]